MAPRGGTTFFSICAVFLSLIAHVPSAHAGETASGEAKSTDAGAAFNSAKELGTAEAWNAFLSNYPAGFHADLARAYLKKLADQTPAASSQAPTGVAQELGCAERGKVRSLRSEVATKLTFVNGSGMDRSIQWIDFNGGFKDYGGVNPGERLTLDTFVSHPWMIATGPGDCLQIFMPDTIPANVELLALAADDGPPKGAAKKQKQAAKEPEKKKKLVCAENYKLRNGKCVLVQNCGKNAYRGAEGDCYCNKNYVMKNGTCVWKTDKKGFEVAPWKKGGCKTWRKQCGQGNNAACGQYEANCQVN